MKFCRETMSHKKNIVKKQHSHNFKNNLHQCGNKTGKNDNNRKTKKMTNGWR